MNLKVLHDFYTNVTYIQKKLQLIYWGRKCSRCLKYQNINIARVANKTLATVIISNKIAVHTSAVAINEFLDMFLNRQLSARINIYSAITVDINCSSQTIALDLEWKSKKRV